MAPYLIQRWPLFESVRGELAHLDKILESTLEKKKVRVDQHPFKTDILFLNESVSGELCG